MGKIYSDKLADDIEAFTVHYGSLLPRDDRKDFAGELMDLIGRAGKESVDSIIEALKKA